MHLLYMIFPKYLLCLSQEVDVKNVKCSESRTLPSRPTRTRTEPPTLSPAPNTNSTLPMSTVWT